MARRSLRPHLNQIRTWVRQGRTDAWIAHQLEVTVQQIEAFTQSTSCSRTSAEGAAGTGARLRRRDRPARRGRRAHRRRARGREAARAEEEARRAAEAAERGDEPTRTRPPPRTRSPGAAAGAAGAAPAPAARPAALEGTFDHGEEGYGLWLDPAVADDPIYAEHWAGHRPVVVTVEEDQIVIRRAGEDDGDDA